MSYIKRIVCLAASLKHGGLCIAGREVAPGRFGGWVRPISARPGSELSYLEYRYEDSSSPRVLDVIDVPLLGPSRHGHQTENVLIDGSRRWVRRGRAGFRRLLELKEEPEALWANSGSAGTGRFNFLTPAEAAGFDWSLCLIQVSKAEIEVGRGVRGSRAFKMSFEYRDVVYKLSLTDPAIRDEFEPRGFGKYPFQDRGDIFLCVSLSEKFKTDGRCHKLIAAVMTPPAI